MPRNRDTGVVYVLFADGTKVPQNYTYDKKQERKVPVKYGVHIGMSGYNAISGPQITGEVCIENDYPETHVIGRVYGINNYEDVAEKCIDLIKKHMIKFPEYQLGISV